MINNISTVEQAVIGQIVLFGKTALLTAEEYITAKDFESETCAEIFSAAQEIALEKKEIDVIMLEKKLGIDYRVLLVTLAHSTIELSKNTYRENLRIVRDEAKERRVRTMVFRIATGEYTDIGECREILTEAMECLENTGNSQGMEAKEGYLDFVSRADHPPEYILTGSRKIDKRLSIEPGDFIVVGGRPSSGKTALTLQMMLSIAKHYRAVYFSLETREDKIFNRLIANFTQTPLDIIKQINVVENSSWQINITQSYDTFKDLNFKVVNAAGWSVSEIFAKAKREKAKVIFIDYLGLIRGKGNTRYEQATNVSNDVHTMAQRTQIATFALCQLNRDGKDPPDMTNLRDSGAIEQDADAIMLLSLPNDVSEDEKKKERILNLVKNKEGECGAVRYRFDGKCQRFYELEMRR